MPHTVEWKVRLRLFEEEGTTKARAVLDTGTTELTGHGDAHRNPADMDVPEIGDELVAGRAPTDLDRAEGPPGDRLAVAGSDARRMTDDAACPS